MIIQRDNSPEQSLYYEKIQARSGLVEASCLDLATVLYNEFESFWSQPARSVPGAGSVIDHTFIKANIEAQVSQLAGDRAVTDAQRRVMEALDEFSA